MSVLTAIVQDLVLYVTVLLGILLYVGILRRQQADNEGQNQSVPQRRYLTLALFGVITMIFGVGCAHQLWPQANDLWLVILGILILIVAYVIYRLRKLSPKTN